MVGFLVDKRKPTIGLVFLVNFFVTPVHTFSDLLLKMYLRFSGILHQVYRKLYFAKYTFSNIIYTSMTQVQIRE